MKYEEAKKEIENLLAEKSSAGEYKVKVNDKVFIHATTDSVFYRNDLSICSYSFDVYYNTHIILAIKTSLQYVINTYTNAGDLNKLPEFDKVFKIVSELAATPIEDRINKDNQTYYVRLKGIDCEQNYLNYDRTAETYFLNDETEDSEVQTTFTKKEIDNMVNNRYFFLQEGSYVLEPAE